MSRFKRIMTRGIWGSATNIFTFGYYPVSEGVIVIGKVCIGTISMSMPGASFTMTLPAASVSMSVPTTLIEIEDCDV